ncbi:maleylpyruvate isomerase N-terminal domain-containing protein [Streptomyces galbus]|uniref:maleylpyruvate isomerase N-terminal domain-containing protein n=1 Tax=Streptomyces galbus TaxID=33898 RepID=UPI0019C2AC8B|nr:maleylpyruvate isomerase N-terminal domain-containing protein [Streptomyces galbus]GHD25992.1 hypothetical protein GCM10010335_11900 [Streptomyces galbus]
MGAYRCGDPAVREHGRRAAEIEAGARRPVAELVADVRATAARFEEAVRALPPAAWHAEVRMRTGEWRTPATLVPTRLRGSAPG